MKKNYRIFLLIGILLVVIVGVLFIINKDRKNEKVSVEIKTIHHIHHGMLVDYNQTEYKDTVISNYDEYTKFVEYYELENKMEESDFKDFSYLVAYAENDYCGGRITGIRNVTIEQEKINIEVGIETSCGPCSATYDIYLIALDKEEIKDDYQVVYDYVKENDITCDPNVSYKPIIYLYPTAPTQVNIKLGYPDKLTTTYPKYEDEWNVLAHPNGNLIDLKTNRNLYGLYWEGLNTSSKGIQEEGFVVKKENTIEFLEEKLAILGLTEREANEFIIYWLPLLEQNEYNYIRFESIDEINANMPLKVNPTPDTVIRVLMEYKGLEAPIEVKEQTLHSPERKGFTLVEWGGTKLN